MIEHGKQGISKASSKKVQIGRISRKKPPYSSSEAVDEAIRGQRSPSAQAEVPERHEASSGQESESEADEIKAEDVEDDPTASTKTRSWPWCRFKKAR